MTRLEPNLDLVRKSYLSTLSVARGSLAPTSSLKIYTPTAMSPDSYTEYASENQSISSVTCSESSWHYKKEQGEGITQTPEHKESMQSKPDAHLLSSQTDAAAALHLISKDKAHVIATKPLDPWKLSLAREDGKLSKPDLDVSLENDHVALIDTEIDTGAGGTTLALKKGRKQNHVRFGEPLEIMEASEGSECATENGALKLKEGNAVTPTSTQKQKAALYQTDSMAPATNENLDVSSLPAIVTDHPDRDVDSFRRTFSTGKASTILVVCPFQ